ncbi:MAG: hypothetical protein DME86_10580 [Verrucomicrobia bacterium]|nr:MAG: hypothetical protein DME86_10580 [Verrucomicrobiota bacterium]
MSIVDLKFKPAPCPVKNLKSRWKDLVVLNLWANPPYPKAKAKFEIRLVGRDFIGPTNCCSDRQSLMRAR